MKCKLSGLLIVVLLLAGCAGNKQFTVPVEEYQQKVRTLAVLPLLVDGDTIEHPQAADVTLMLEQEGRALSEKLVERLRKKGGYFDVRLAPAVSLLDLVAAKATVGENAATHLEYSLSTPVVAETCEIAVADAVLAVIVHGVKRTEKRWNPHSMRLEYLSTGYSSVLWTAEVVDKSGTLLWRHVEPAGEVLLPLDYADFTEAYWNHSDEVKVKSITLLGLQRAVSEPSDGLFVDKTLSKLFNGMVQTMVDQLSPGLFSGIKDAATPAPK